MTLHFALPADERPACTENDEQRRRHDGQAVEVVQRAGTTAVVRAANRAPDRKTFVVLVDELVDEPARG